MEHLINEEKISPSKYKVWNSSKDIEFIVDDEWLDSIPREGINKLVMFNFEWENNILSELSWNMGISNWIWINNIKKEVTYVASFFALDTVYLILYSSDDVVLLFYTIKLQYLMINMKIHLMEKYLSIR